MGDTPKRLTYQRASELLDYDPASGVLRHRVNRGSRGKAGCVAGRRRADGYRGLSIDSRFYQEHRVAWLLVHGEFPANEIDHINGVRDDNRLINLRAVTKLENHRNQRLMRHNTSGVCGVSWQRARCKWCASIRVKGEDIHLGSFLIKADAIEARKAANQKYGFHPNHGNQLPQGYRGMNTQAPNQPAAPSLDSLVVASL